MRTRRGTPAQKPGLPSGFVPRRVLCFERDSVHRGPLLPPNATGRVPLFLSRSRLSFTGPFRDRTPFDLRFPVTEGGSRPSPKVVSADTYLSCREIVRCREDRNLSFTGEVDFLRRTARPTPPGRDRSKRFQRLPLTPVFSVS